MRILLAVLGLLLASFAPGAVKVEPADLILFNGNVYTANDKHPHAEAVAVRMDRIVFAGTNSEAKKYQGPKTRVVDLHGATVLPGLADAHYHFIGVGQRERNLNLEGITNLQDFLAKVKERVDQAKPGEWVTGRGWIETFWQPPVFPTRWDLDKIAPNNPVLLTRADGHGAVANSAALKRGNVTKETKDPFGGQILRDKQTGEPVGMLLDAGSGSGRQLRRCRSLQKTLRRRKNQTAHLQSCLRTWKSGRPALARRPGDRGLWQSPQCASHQSCF
jgi:predicted amidohydrolase YtcJ